MLQGLFLFQLARLGLRKGEKTMQLIQAIQTGTPVHARLPLAPSGLVRTRIREWIDACNNADGTFDIRDLQPFYAEGSVKLLSDFGSDVEVSDSFAEYAALWAPVLKECFESWTIMPVGEVEVDAQPSMASASFILRMDGRTCEEQIVTTHYAMSQVWQRRGGRWVITLSHSTINAEGWST